MTEIVLPKSTPARVVALVKKMEIESGAFGDDSTAATFDILDAILRATDEAEIFKAANAGTTSGQDFIDVPFRLKEDGLSARKSTKNNEAGLPFYFQLNVTRIDTGEPTVISCGGLSAVAVLSTLRDNGILAKYEGEGGMPLFFSEKAAGNGNVLLVQPYKGNGSSKK